MEVKVACKKNGGGVYSRYLEGNLRIEEHLQVSGPAAGLRVRNLIEEVPEK